MYSKLFRERKEHNAKLKRSYIYRYVNNLFKLNKEDFWRKIKQLGRRSGNVNMEAEELKRKYENVFNETNCEPSETAKAQKTVDDYKSANEAKTFNTKTESAILEGLIAELPNGKSVGIREVSNEMLKYCQSAKLMPFIAEMFDTMINQQIQPEGFNVSVLKPILKSESKPNDDFANTRPVAISDAIQNLFEGVLLWRLNGKQTWKALGKC